MVWLRFDKPRKSGKRPAIVPKIFGALWKLYLAPRPNIQVPNPCPIVHLSKVNNFLLRNLPKPTLIPIKGAHTFTRGPSHSATRTGVPTITLLTKKDAPVFCVILPLAGCRGSRLTREWFGYQLNLSTAMSGMMGVELVPILVKSGYLRQ